MPNVKISYCCSVYAKYKLPKHETNERICVPLWLHKLQKIE